MTSVYKYGLLPPTLGGDIVTEQMTAAHRYRNTLTELERARRAAVRAAVEDDAIRAIDGEIAAALAATQPTKDLWVRRKAAVKERRELPEVQAAVVDAYESFYAAVKEARARCGVYWGTYLQVEAAAEQAAKSPAEPRFSRWTGDGAVAVQIQGGMDVDRLTGTQDSRLRLCLVPLPVPGRGGKPLPRLSVRVGSVGRDPVWAEWPIIFHRPFPEGARVKWCKVVRRMVAGKAQWSAHFTIDVEGPGAAPGGDRVVALDLGWARVDEDKDSATRAGAWHDGERGGDVIMNPAIRGELAKCDDVRSIRDRHQLAMHGQLTAWIKAHGIPDSHREKFEHIALWKAPGKFASLALWWRQNRFAGDAPAFDLLEQWRRRDKHLWLWEANARQSAIARRRDQYRCVGARLAGEYDVLVVEKLDLAKLALVPPADDPGQQQSRKQKQATAASELRNAVVNAFRRKGKTVVEVPAGRGARALISAYRERGGEELARQPARSLRQSRLRKNKGTGTAVSG